MNANAVITIDDDGIIIKRIYHPEHHSWNEFSNVVVKDGLLTLDYTNNKVLQLLIKELKTSEEERKFNQYCRRKLVDAT